MATVRSKPGNAEAAEHAQRELTRYSSCGHFGVTEYGLNYDTEQDRPMSVCREVCLSRRKRSTFSLAFRGFAAGVRDPHLGWLIEVSFVSIPQDSPVRVYEAAHFCR